MNISKELFILLKKLISYHKNILLGDNYLSCDEDLSQILLEKNYLFHQLFGADQLQ